MSLTLGFESRSDAIGERAGVRSDLMSLRKTLPNISERNIDKVYRRCKRRSDLMSLRKTLPNISERNIDKVYRHCKRRSDLMLCKIMSVAIIFFIHRIFYP